MVQVPAAADGGRAVMDGGNSRNPMMVGRQLGQMGGDGGCDGDGGGGDRWCYLLPVDGGGNEADGTSSCFLPLVL